MNKASAVIAITALSIAYCSQANARDEVTSMFLEPKLLSPAAISDLCYNNLSREALNNPNHSVKSGELIIRYQLEGAECKVYEYNPEPVDAYSEIDQLTESLAAALAAKLWLETEAQRLTAELEEYQQIVASPDAAVAQARRINQLCIWMKTYKHLDVLDKTVYVNGEYFKLCD